MDVLKRNTDSLCCAVEKDVFALIQKDSFFGRAGNGGVSASLWMDCVQSSRSSFQLNDYVFWGGKLRESDRKAERSFKDMERSEYK